MAKKVIKTPFNYQAARDELDAILIELQQEDLDIEQAAKQFERGQQLIAELENYLNQAENRITELKTRFKSDSSGGDS